MSKPPKEEDPPPYEAVASKVYNPAPPSSLEPFDPPSVVLANSSTQYGPEPQQTICPYCHANIRTLVRAEPTQTTHISALLLCCVCWVCACLPYFIDSCQNRNHYCPNCDAYLGSYGG